MKNNNKHSVILFDGICPLCILSIQFIIKHDVNKIFRFASLQSSFANNELSKNSIPSKEISTIILIEENKVYTKSTAALKIAKQLNGIWKIFYLFIFIPPFIRNFIYDIIANNRYKWFGKKESCWFPSAALEDLFINE